MEDELWHSTFDVDMFNRVAFKMTAQHKFYQAAKEILDEETFDKIIALTTDKCNEEGKNDNRTDS